MTIAFQDIGAELGPLQHIWIGADGSANVRHVADDEFQFYPSTAYLGDLGTFLAVGSLLYAPALSDATHGTTGSANIGSYTAWYNRSQSTVIATENGLQRVTTILETANAALRIYQTDTYVAGHNAWRTDMILVNRTTGTLTPVLYRAGDAFLHASNNGYGSSKPAYGAVGVSESADATPPANGIWMWPLVADDYYENTAGNLWTAVGNKAAFANTIKTDLSHDAGLGLSWSLTIPAKSLVTRSCLTQIRIAAPITDPASQPWRFRGYCYRGADGDMSSPLSGVTLKLWVTSATSGRYVKRTTVSDGSGFWNFYEDQEFTTYEVECITPSGMAATGVSTGDGTIMSYTLLKWVSPARGVHGSNRFFMQ